VEDWSDEEEDNESAPSASETESDTSESGWSFSKSRLGNFLNTVSGNKILAREDLEPVINPMRQHVCVIHPYSILCSSCVSHKL
jgi:hypothetical protein